MLRWEGSGNGANYSFAIISRMVAIRFLIPAIFSGQEPPVGVGIGDSGDVLAFCFG